MSFARARASLGAALAAAALLAGGGVLHAGPAARPLRIVIVEEQAAAGTSVSAQLVRILRDAFESRPCGFVALPRGGGETAPGEIELRVIVEGVNQEVRYLQSLAERARNPDPYAADAYVARFDMRVRLEWVRAGETEPLARKRERVVQQQRPRVPGEDAGAVARREALAELARAVRRRTCRLKALR